MLLFSDDFGLVDVFHLSSGCSALNIFGLGTVPKFLGWAGGLEESSKLNVKVCHCFIPAIMTHISGQDCSF